MSEEKQETDQISPAACLLLMAKQSRKTRPDAGKYSEICTIWNFM